ncbi:hypothetical protein CMV_016161 [Castanea mollissima]|uniref:Uncharacterized protein n=1 Tax=Castanea mollissima TaxID=60419 RepID=A0A8J4R8G8_9ROSI|nr:hypothetical protein CMV_016161 [Castanea mollissima]
MGHGMLVSKDDRPTANSIGFGATTTTTRSLGVSGIEADDDDGVELVSETQKIKKDHLKAFGVMPETFGGEYNCLFGDSLWEDPHCCTAYIQVESLDKEAQEEDMHLFAPTMALVQQGSYYLPCGGSSGGEKGAGLLVVSAYIVVYTASPADHDSCSCIWANASELSVIFWSLASKWGKRLFIGCIPIEATIDNMQLHFSQFGHALDLYLPMVKVVDLYLEECPRCHHDMPLVGIGTCLGLIGIGMWVAGVSKEEPQKFLIISKKLKNSLRGQNRGKHMKSLRKDVKFRLVFKGSGYNFILNRVLHCNWFVPCFILHDLWLKVC